MIEFLTKTRGKEIKYMQMRSEPNIFQIHRISLLKIICHDRHNIRKIFTGSVVIEIEQENRH